MKINIKKQSGIYTLTSEQILPISLEKAWEFFTHPNNLDRITPKEMQFEITNNPPDKTYIGQIITYKIGILPMVKSNWITEITHFEDGKFFVDEQRFGPYKLWHHQHHFKAIEGGVEMTDIIHYKNPMWFLGTLANELFVKKQLQGIFDFRFKKVEEMFGKWN